MPESTSTEEEEEVQGVEVADAESQTDLQGLKTKVIEAEALESSGLVEALVAYPKGAEKEEGDAAASSSAVKREAPPGHEKKGAEAAAPPIQVKTEPEMENAVMPATMNEMPLDAPETAEAEEAAPAASKAEDGEKRLIQPQKKQKKKKRQC